MKRKGHLYEATYDFNNIVDAYNEVCRNTKNKRKVEFFREYKCVYVSRIYNILKNEEYEVGPYNIFTIYIITNKVYIMSTSTYCLLYPII